MNPSEEPRLARMAAMIADPARSRMLALLLDGHYASAGELAKAGGVSAPTASVHLGKLVDSGLLVVESRGRHRYFKLADADVAHALEALSLLADRHTHERQWQGGTQQGLRYARCCYGHLAGELGVQLMAALQRQGCIAPAHAGDGGAAHGRSFALTPTGAQWWAELGLAPLSGAQQRDRRLAYACLDWSERRDHLAGSLATTLLKHFIDSGWLRAAPGPAERSGRNRALLLTPPGHQRLLPLLQAGAELRSVNDW